MRYELRDVVVEKEIRSSKLAEAEIDDPRVVLGIDEHVGKAKVPVGDAEGAQNGDLSPGLGENAVREFLRRNGVE